MVQRHRNLNDALPGGVASTTENVAAFILEALRNTQAVGPLLKAIRVFESSTTWCEVTAK